MHEQNVAIIKGLISMAWADGQFLDPEKQALEGLLAAFGASDEEAESLRQYAETKRTIDDVPVEELSGIDRRMLLHHAVLLSWVDGEQAESETAMLHALAQKLDIPESEASDINEKSTERAKRYLKLL